MAIPISDLQTELSKLILTQGISGNLISLVRGSPGPQGPQGEQGNPGDRLEINQTGHGFTQGDAIYFNGSNWQKAIANSINTVGLGLADILDDDNFFIVYSGFLEGLTGFTPGNFYFTSSENPGELVTSEPDISNPLFLALDSTYGLVLPWRPSYSTDGPGSSDSSSASSTLVAVNKTGHGFTGGMAVYFDGTNWQKALANSLNTLGIGVVSYVDSNNFNVAVCGSLYAFTGLSAGNYYFVSDTLTGGLTTTEPAISNPLMFALSATHGIILPYRPSYETASSGSDSDSTLSTSIPVNFTGHSFSTGMAVYFNGVSWQKAIANSVNTLGIGIVSYIDANNFSVAVCGSLYGFSGLSAGNYYFVSDTITGGLTTTEPSISNPLLLALSATHGVVLPYRPSYTGESTPGDSSSAASTTISVNETGHSFSTGMAVYFDGTNWQKALSDTTSTLGIGIASYVDADNFDVVVCGSLYGFSSLSPGEYYFVSSSLSGGLTTTEPSISNPLVFAISATHGIVLPWRPSVNDATVSEEYIVSSTSMTASKTVDTIFVSSSGTLNVRLYSCSEIPGKRYYIKKTNSTNTVVVLPSGAETIDGLTSISLTTQYTSYGIVNDGTSWYILSKYIP